jgi:chorismate mutase
LLARISILPSNYIRIVNKDQVVHLPDIAPIDSWWPSNSHPYIISGPCSAETEEQMLRTAALIHQQGHVHLFRAGIWKPRTRPNSFEGVGEIGLHWLAEVKKQFGFKTTVEVANANHVELALKHGVDVLWIGARTTVNPFSVQEIADVLKGTDTPVFIKNPINPDLQLWIGGIERIYAAGIRKLGAIHRGFSYYGESIYRNKPMWEIPIALMAQLPNLPVFGDPSHISGKRELLASVGQKALDLGMKGLMIESHITPDQAWSDAKQQVTPDGLSQLLNGFQVREVQSTNQAFAHHLNDLRQKIDHVDEEIIKLIGERMKISEEVGRYKKENNITILQLERYKEIIRTRTEWARKMGLTEEFIEIYLEQLHKESIRTQTRVMNQ